MENPFEENVPQRPTMLSVLCILTFIGSGWSVLSGLFSLIGGGNSEQSMQTMYSMINGNPDLANMMQSMMETLQVMATHAKSIGMINLVLSVISLLGAIMMFRLKRLGFYLYAAAQVVMLFILPYFAGFSFLVVAMFAVSAVFSAIFIILYAVNLKHLK